MSTAFDPYHRWLGIRPEEQPPDHYRLLGLARFEDDIEVIRDAAERQMSHVRRYAVGDHADDAKRILNELGAAKACLIVRDKKLSYDATLRSEGVVERDVNHAAETPGIDLQASSDTAPIVPEIAEPNLGVVASSPDMDDSLQLGPQAETSKTLARTQSLRRPRRSAALSGRAAVRQVDDFMKRIAGAGNPLLHGFLRVCVLAGSIVFSTVCLLAAGSWAIQWNSDATQTVASTSGTVATVSPTPPTPTPSPPPTPPPLVLEPIDDAEVDEGKELQLEFALADAASVSDSVRFEFVGASHGAMLDPRGVFKWTPTEAQGPGDFLFQVRAVTSSDAAQPRASEPLGFKVVVLETNQPPQLEPIDEQQVTVGDELKLTPQATDPDLPASIDSPSVSTAEAAAADTVLTLTAHSGPITSVTFTKDGKRLLSASKDGTAKLWDVVAGKELKSFAGDGSPVDHAAFLDNECKVIVCGGTTEGSAEASVTFRIIEVETGRQTGQIEAEAGARSIVVLDERYVLVAGRDNGIMAWDLKRLQTSSECLKVGGGLDMSINAIAGGRRGRILLADHNGAVHIWQKMGTDWSRGKELGASPASEALITSIAVGSRYTGAVVSGDANGTVRVWDYLMRSYIHKLSCSFPVECVAASPVAEYIAAGGHSGQILLWEAVHGRRLKAFDGPGEKTTALAFSPHGSRLIAGSQAGAIRLWRLEAPLATLFEPDIDASRYPSKEHLAMLTLTAYQYYQRGAEAYSPESDRYLLVEQSRLHVVDLAARKQIASERMPRVIRTVAISQSGRYVGCSAGSEVRILDLDTRARWSIDISSLDLGLPWYVSDLVFHSNQPLVAALFKSDGQGQAGAAIWDVSLKTIVGQNTNLSASTFPYANTLRFDSATQVSALSSNRDRGTVCEVDPNFLAAESPVREVTPREDLAGDVNDDKEGLREYPGEVRRFNEPGAAPSLLAFSGTTAHVAAIVGNRIVVWDSVTGKVISEWKTNELITGIDVNSNGDIAAASWSRELFIYAMEVKNRAALRLKLNRSLGSPTGVRFFPNETLVFWEGFSGLAAIDFRAERLTLNIARTVGDSVPQDWCLCGDLAPNGRYAVSGGRDTILLWDLAQPTNTVPPGATMLTRINVDDSVRKIRFLGDGDGEFVVALTGERRSGTRRMRFWELATGQEAMLVGENASARDIAVSNDGQRLVVSSDEGVSCWNMPDLRQISFVLGSKSPIAISSDGAKVVSTEPNGQVVLWSPE